MGNLSQRGAARGESSPRGSHARSHSVGGRCRGNRSARAQCTVSRGGTRSRLRGVP